MESGYARVGTKKGKFYAPFVKSMKQVRFLRMTFKTATMAADYSKEFTKKWKSLHEKEKMAGG